MTRENTERLVHEYDRQVDRIDVELNVRLALDRDPRYLKLNRLLKKRDHVIPERFSKPMGYRILHDAHIFIKYRDNKAFLDTFESRAARNFESYFSSGEICKRFIKHEMSFARHANVQLERAMRLEKAQEFDTDGNNVQRYGESFEKVLAQSKPGFYDPEIERLKRIKARKLPPVVTQVPSPINASEEDLKNISRKPSTTKTED
jgi:hypothetical protein